jgi:lipopolysaccharide export system permease protein
MRILHRYILTEMLKALAMAMAAVSGVVCFALVLVALQQKGLDPLSSLLYMALSIPGAVYIALPLSAILATTLVYGRLAADNEVMACRASGIPISSLFWPGVLMAMVAGGTALGLAAWPLPESTYAAKRLAMADIERHFFTELANGRISVKERNFQLSVDRVVGDILYGPTIKSNGPNGQTYCYAPCGRVEFNRKENKVTLALWEAFIIDEVHALPVRGTHTVAVPLPTVVPRDEDELSLWRLLAVTRHPELSEGVQALVDRNASPALIRMHENKFRARATGVMHGRMATALGCLGLVLVGAGLGMYFHSGHLLTAFFVALAPWMGSMLLTMTAVKAVAKTETNPQDLAWCIWAPNAAVVVLGLAILGFLTWFWGRPVRLRDRLLGRRRPAGPAQAEGAA